MFGGIISGIDDEGSDLSVVEVWVEMDLDCGVVLLGGAVWRTRRGV